MAKKQEQRGVGRPTENNRPTRKVYLTLDEETIEAAKKLGGGNVSAGVRMKFSAKRKKEPSTD